MSYLYIIGCLKMNFLSWLLSKGYSDSEIGEINNSLIKNKHTYISAIQLAVKYIEENIIVGDPPYKTKREIRKEKTDNMYNSLFHKNKDLYYFFWQVK